MAGSKNSVAYIMSRFPKLTETFVLYEILEVERLGVRVEIFPLLRENQKVTHAEARALVTRAHFQPFLSRRILWAQWYFIRRKRGSYFALLSDVFRGTLGSINFFFGALGIFPKAVLFAYEMEDLNIRHVHAHFATHPAVAAYIVHRLTGIPYSFTAHGSDLHVDRTMLAQKVQSASFVVAISSYNKSLIVQECGEEVRNKTHVIHCGVDTDLFQPRRMERPPGLTSATLFQILCVGSFEEVKGHEFLVDACSVLAHKRVNFVCHLVGEGPLRHKTEKQVYALGLAESITFHGGLPRAEIVAMLSEVDAFVLASVPTKRGKREGIPVVLIEAMASGLPVVASDLSGIPELVENGASGILVPPRNSDMLAGALERLYQKPALRTDMGLCGRRRVLSDFCLCRNTRRLLELIEASCVNGHRANFVESSVVQQDALMRYTLPMKIPKQGEL